jgi:hypothetical protein
MSTFAGNAAAFAALAVVMGIVLYAVLAAGLRIIRDNGRLRLGEMLRRNGSTPEQALDGGYQSAIAVRRCMMCSQKAECDQWLPSGAKLGMEAFCPNAGFIGRIATSR